MYAVTIFFSVLFSRKFNGFLCFVLGLCDFKGTLF